MTKKERPRLLIIDGHSMAFRAFFALPADKFSTSGGQVTNAVYGFTSMMINLLRDEEPTHLAVAFDVSNQTFRTAEYPEYKGTREKTPEEFGGQIPLIKQVMAAMGVVTVEADGFEADDILATLSTQGAQAGFEVLVCSGDRDAFQLVNEDVTVLYPKRGVSDLTRMTPQAVADKYGVGPDRYSDLAALVGEKSDNLPGVPGVGPKTAAKWIGSWGSLEELLAHADEIKGKAGESLRAHLDDVKRNRKLNQLLRDMELPITLEDLERGRFQREDVHELFDALQFRSLRERLFALDPETETEAESAQVSIAVTEVPSGNVAEWLAEHPTKHYGLDIEGSVAAGSGDAWRISIASSQSEALSIDRRDAGAGDLTALEDFLEDENIAKIVHDAKRALHCLDGVGIQLRGINFDTSIAAYLCHPDERKYDLADLLERYTGRRVSSATGSGQQELDLNGDNSAQESGERATATLALAHELEEAVQARHARGLLADLELPVARVLASMEKAGIACDVDYLHELSEHFDSGVREAANKAYAEIDREVNLSSPKQLQQVLFDQLGMPKTRKTKTGYTTDANALADLFVKTQHPFLEQLLIHRDQIKLRQTVEGLLRWVAEDGRIHTTFLQTVAATGRLSSADPNLQNIPARTPQGQQIRAAFVVGKGYSQLMTADYSQIEMRIMAHLSEDEGLIEAFRSGEDLHSFVGSRVFGVEPSEVTPAMRSKIKAMSYGLAYGLSAFGLSRQLKIETAEARNLMADYFERFGGVRDYLHQVVEQARKDGYTQTIMGRRRYLPDLTSDNRQRREMAERMALNAPIQGSAADIIKRAMISVDEAIAERGLGSRLLLQVHDELIVEVVDGEEEAVEEILRSCMGAAAELAVPLDVSVGHGADWKSAGH